MANFIKLSQTSINEDWIASVQWPLNPDEVPEEETPAGALVLKNPNDVPTKELAIVRLAIASDSGAPVTYTFEKGTDDYKKLRQHPSLADSSQVGKVEEIEL